MKELELFPEYDNKGNPLLFHHLLECDYKTIVCQGGRRSLKTFSIHELFILRSILNKNQIRIVVGWDVPHMRRGCLMDMVRIFRLFPDAKSALKSYNSTEAKFYFHSGSTIQFASFEKEEDAKMTDIDDFYMNECNHTKFGFGIYNQMKMQCRGQAYLDYNPSSPFWVHVKLIGRPDTALFISDHRHNPFLSQGQHETIENQYAKGSELWKVYARGRTGRIEGSIYPNWKVIQNWPDGIEQVIWGVDYGYSIGKTAIIKVGYLSRREIVVKLCCYKPGITAEGVRKIIEANGYKVGQPFYSEHDRDMINQLRGSGMPVYYARKGDQSEWNGILKCQEYDVSYVYDADLSTELMSYQWESVASLETGEEILTQSVKDTKKYHAMAAFRMAVYTHESKRSGYTE